MKEICRFLIDTCEVNQIIFALLDRYIVEIERLNEVETIIILKEKEND